MPEGWEKLPVGLATYTDEQVNAEAERLLVGKPGIAICFLDLETGGLDPDYHEIWEVAIIRRDPDGTETEWVEQLNIDATKADPEALAVGRFWDRRHPAFRMWSHEEVAAQVRTLTKDAVIVGQNPGFDVAFLRRFLMLLPGEDPPWHYRPLCVTTLAAGYIAGKLDRVRDFAVLDLPWSSRDIAEAVDIDVSAFAKHTALGDAQLARAIYDRVMG